MLRQFQNYVAAGCLSLVLGVLGWSGEPREPSDTSRPKLLKTYNDLRCDRMELSPCGKYLAIAGSILGPGPKDVEGRFQLLDTATWRVKHDLSIPRRGMVTRFVFSPDSSLIVTNTIADVTDVNIIWDVKTGKVVTSLTSDSAAGANSFSRDGRYFTQPESPNKIAIYDTKTWEVKQTLTSNLDRLPIAANVWSMDSKHLIVAVTWAEGLDPGDLNLNVCQLRVFDVQKGTEQLIKHRFEWVNHLAMSNCGKYVALSGQSRKIPILDWREGEEKCVLKTDNKIVVDVCFLPDDRLMVVGLEPNAKQPEKMDKTLEFWNWQEEKLLLRTKEFRDGSPIRLSPDGKQLYQQVYPVGVWLWQLPERFHAPRK